MTARFRKLSRSFFASIDEERFQVLVSNSFAAPELMARQLAFGDQRIDHAEADLQQIGNLFHFVKHSFTPEGLKLIDIDASHGRSSCIVNFD